VSANAAPVVTITSPADASSSTETDEVTFTATATDTEDGDLAPSLAWTSSLDGSIGTGATFPLTTLSVGAHQITAAVTDSHGAPASDVIDITVNANTAPVVTISEPSNVSTSLVGDPLTFTGDAFDAEDGDVTVALVWTSDLDDQIGTGASFTTSSLSEGTHVVTATSIDSHGLPGFSTVTTLRLPEPGSEGLIAGLMGITALARRRRLVARQRVASGSRL
jgi:hypothetical protein